MSRRHDRVWPTHKGSANRRRRARPRPLASKPEPRTYEGMARRLVDQGLATPAILNSTKGT